MGSLISKLRRRRELWTIALFKMPDDANLLDLGAQEPFHFIGERGLRARRSYQSTVADPFLFAGKDRLFVFYEVKTDFGHGVIHAQAMDISGRFEDFGCVLREPFHLSYPQVFEHKGQLWMIPEASASGKVWLYRAEDFPSRWVKDHVLIDEPLVDASLLVSGADLYLLATTARFELKLYHSDSLDRQFVSSSSIITEDKAFARNGGSPVWIEGQCYRLAQNCARKYGENVGVLRVIELSPTKYSEVLVTPDLFIRKPQWMSLGHHHISTAVFAGTRYIAVDGMRPDRLLNNISLAVLKLGALHA